MVHNRLLVIWLSRELVSPITALPCLLGRGPESTCFVLTTVKRGKRTVSVPAFMLRGWKVKVGISDGDLSVSSPGETLSMPSGARDARWVQDRNASV